MLLLHSLLLAPLLLSSSTTTASAQDVIITKTITSGPDPSAATASASAAAEFTSSALFTSAILNSTNTYRDQHNATHLVWNRTLEDFANRYLREVVSKRSPDPSTSSTTSDLEHLEERDGRKDRRGGGRCDFKHSGGPYGENLALGCSNATSCVAAWGDERREYDFGKGDFGEATGHFTQLVWKNTTSVGCGARMCGGGSGGNDDGSARGWYLVCEYWPRGNVIGQFKEEVQAQENGGGLTLRALPRTLGLVVGLVVSSVLTTTTVF
ncbi:SCP-like extracellular protein [Apiospora arundinis]|uniref:SCP-like extracellular protein n=1 Tax=Apiospora arundinis TaxID=335852 RepID=A0ABR2I4H0_9PEZI